MGLTGVLLLENYKSQHALQNVKHWCQCSCDMMSAVICSHGILTRISCPRLCLHQCYTLSLRSCSVVSLPRFSCHQSDQNPHGNLTDPIMSQRNQTLFLWVNHSCHDCYGWKPSVNRAYRFLYSAGTKYISLLESVQSTHFIKMQC